MNCKKCKSDNVHVINEVKVKGGGYSFTNACCGRVMLGPVGYLCGLCGRKPKAKNTKYWACNNCGYTWKA